jgi:hypothetical protein
VAELLKQIIDNCNKKNSNKMSLADISNNRIAIGVQSEEEFNTLCDKLIELSKRASIEIAKGVWNAFMVENDVCESSEIMIEEGTMYIIIYNNECCGFCDGPYYKSIGYKLMLFKDCNIDYTYDKEYCKVGDSKVYKRKF